MRESSALVSVLVDLPPLPIVAIRIADMTDDPRTSASDIARVVRTDPALTAKLLRASNSALYVGVAPASTAQDAIVRLGFERVRAIVLAASLVRTYRFRPLGPDDLDPDLFWAHSVMVAVAAESLAGNTGTARRDHAFTAGIVHDIGRLALRMVFTNKLHEAVAAAKRGQGTLAQAERRLTGFDHVDLGVALAETWGFPEPLVSAIAHHHDESATPATMGLAGAVAEAHRWVTHHGFHSGYEATWNSAANVLPQDLDAVDEALGGIGPVFERARQVFEEVTGKAFVPPPGLLRSAG